MHILIINLASSTERRETMTVQLAPLGIPFTFIDAVNGRGKQPEDFSEYAAAERMQTFGRAMTGTEVACTLSHLKAMHYALEKEWDRVCILEDDGVLTDQFLSQLTYAFNLPRTYELVSLYSNKVNDRGAGRYLKRSRYKQWSGALGYVVTSRAMLQIIEWNKRVLYIADQAVMGRPEMDVAVWHLLPKPIHLNPELASDIGDARERRSYTTANRLRRIRGQAAAWVRRWWYVLTHPFAYIPRKPPQ